VDKTCINYLNERCINTLVESLKKTIDEKTIIVCIGTDRCIGDCLGPLVGSLLIDRKFPLKVFGSLNKPIHALNLEENLNYINNEYPNHNIIGIDACLSDDEDIGNIIIRDYPICPGKGVGKYLPPVGNLSIVAVVDSYNNSEPFYSRSIRLNFIMNMAKKICISLEKSYTLKI